ncbi:hypothetical protein PUMCH_004277 [Australozyma saopauloensis]|uniref:Uncharacterized protein n=1 Tax=Australozyma saopauloensis TaxID=291208 RepID=A0AAX4HEC7_9ASCO|nr:hypothetical protein PUMCH_004277 [[Candida] saopauloensis]
MSSIPNVNNLKRVVSKKIRQTVRRLEKNLENLSRNVNPMPQPVRIPVPAQYAMPRGKDECNRSCHWTNLLPCLTHLICSVPLSSVPNGAPTRRLDLGKVLQLYLGRPARFPASALFGRSTFQTLAISVYGNKLASTGFLYHNTRFYSTYSRMNFNQWTWSKINQSIMFKKFSSQSQFRLQKFLSHYRLPTLTQILKKRSKCAQNEFEPRVRLWNIYRELSKKTTRFNSGVTAAANTITSTSLRLNALLTQGFHDMVRVLANEASTVAEGCYVDFKLQPLVLIPEKTMMSADILAELQANLKHFERHLAQLQNDISQLSDLGELPLRYVSSEGIIRVYFPNCDRERLQILLREKNICSGVIYEDFAQEAADLDRFTNVSSVSESDILSSYYLSSVESSSQSEDSDSNVLSLETSSSEFEKNLPGNMLPMHLGNIVPSQGPIMFAEDNYCWA